MPRAMVMPPAMSSVGFISVLQTIMLLAHVPTMVVGIRIVKNADDDRDDAQHARRLLAPGEQEQDADAQEGGCRR